MEDMAASVVEGEVLEVLRGHGIAHVRTADGWTFGIRQQTPGIVFDELREGQRVMMDVSQPFSRVLRAQVIG